MERERDGERQTERERERETEKEMERKTEINLNTLIQLCEIGSGKIS